MLCVAMHVGTILACDRHTGGRTDGRTDTLQQHSLYRASIASRDKKTTLLSICMHIFAHIGKYLQFSAINRNSEVMSVGYLITDLLA